MRLELAERLVCPAAHVVTPLIVVAQETRGRDLIAATLGCMTCHREGRIADGSVLLGAASVAMQPLPPHAPTDDALLRLAALLGLADPQTTVLLGPRYAALAPTLAAQHDAIVAVQGATGPSAAGVGHVQVAEGKVPFASGTFAAVAIDASCPPALVAEMLRCARIGARVLGETDVPVPAAVRALARDASGWVGELEASPIVVPLRRA